MTTARPALGGERAWLVLLAAMLPLVGAWWLKAIADPRPYWVVHYDPEVAYFLSGLNLVQGRPPILVEHPGVPLQLVGAALAMATGHTRPIDVEGFRLPAYTLSLLLTAAGAWLLLRTVLRELPPLLQLAIVWTYFAFPRVLQFQTIWSPETLFFPAGALALAATWRFVQEPTGARAFLMGAATGLCVALKFTFAAWLVGTLAAALVPHGPRARRGLAWTAGASAAFVAGTAAGAARYGYALRWLVGVVTRSGLYGRGAPGWPDLAATSAHVSEALACSSAFIWTWAAAAALLATDALRRPEARRRLAAAALPIAAIPAAYAATFRDPQLRYVFPGALAGLALLALGARALPASGPSAVLPIACALGSALLLGRALGDDLAAHTALVAAGQRTHDAIERLLAGAGAGPGQVVVYGWRAPIPAFALRLGAYARAHHLRAIEETFPDAGDYEAWNGVVHLPAGRSRWDLLVLASRDLAGFPEPTGAIVGTAGDFVVLRAPTRAVLSNRSRANAVGDPSLTR